MRHYWHKAVCALLAVAALSACQSLKPTKTLDFRLDDGEVKSFDFTRRGSLPADDGVYKVEGLGLMLYRNQQNGEVLYAWDAHLNLKAGAAQNVRWSQVLNDGELLPLFEDAAPQQETADPEVWRKRDNGAQVQVMAARWHAVSAGVRLQDAAWLADTEHDAMFVFKFEIQDADGKHHILYQPMVVSRDSKRQYAEVLQDALSVK